MTYEPKHLKRWSKPDCYFGATWPDYYRSGFGQSRDSGALERSNFRCALEALGGESETVFVVRERHWAVGWVEWIAIHESDSAALQIADRLQESVADYPVLDDGDFSEEEQHEADEIWRNCYSPEERIRYIRDCSSQFEFHSFAALLGCVRGNYFAGDASELLN